MDRDLSRSRAILIGNGSYREHPRIQNLGSAQTCIAAMTTLLTGGLCGWPADRVTPLVDVPAPPTLAREIVKAVRDSEDVLFVYYVGHGMRTSDGQLALALGETDPDPETLPHTAMLYENLARILRGSRAATKIVILDCCHAGLAGKAHYQFQSANIAEAYPVDGLYFIGASAAAKKAISPLDTTLTYFTRALIDVVHDGIPHFPGMLSLDQIFREVRVRLVRANLPEPVESGIRGAHQFPFARNAAPVGLSDRPARDVPQVRSHQSAQAPAAAVNIDSVSPTAFRAAPVFRRSVEHAPSHAVRTLTPGGSALEFRADGTLLAAACEGRSAAPQVPPRTRGRAEVRGIAGLPSVINSPPRGREGSARLGARSAQLGAGSAARLEAWSSVRWWVATTGDVLGTAAAHEGCDIFSVAFSPGGKYLATGEDYETVRLWEVDTGTHLRTFKGRTGGVTAVAVSPDGQLVASIVQGESQPRIWETRSGELGRSLARIKGLWPNILVFSPDGSRLAGGGERSEVIALWNPVTGRSVVALNYRWPGIPNKVHTLTSRFIPENDPEDLLLDVRAIAFSPDGSRVIAGHEYISIWKLPARWSIKTLNKDGYIRGMSTLACSPTAPFLAVGSQNSIQIWNLTTGQHLRTLQGHRSQIRALQFSPDGRLLASADSESIRIWE